MLHAPPVQVGVPFAVLQASPHPPQLARLEARLVSQPLAAVQSPQPAAQAPIWQTPALQ